MFPTEHVRELVQNKRRNSDYDGSSQIFIISVSARKIRKVIGF